MYIEDQYIQEQFQKNFIEQRPGNIVIYGTGLHTKELLENIKSERIVGLMDAAKTGEIIYGKKVLSYDEVAGLSDVYIVIIARNSVINVIYRRIQEFVTSNSIPVYNVSGIQLVAADVNVASKECFMVNPDELRKQIAGAEVVSFDIFDTLLCRRVLRPIDVFRMVDVSLNDSKHFFSTERVKAESQLSAESNYNIDDIYKQYQMNTKEPDERIAYLKRLEIETEKRVLRRREAVCDLLLEAYKQGKKVYLISDMYLPEGIIKDILEDKGIVEYDKLYVSTNHKSSKTEALFEIVRDENRLEPTKWLHIGDNPFADVYVPEKLGIKTFRLYSTTEMLEESIYSRILEENHSLEENMIISYFAAEAFNSPFAGFRENGKLVIDDSKLLAMLIVAPLLMKYVVWLSKRLAEKHNDLVLFPTRDGYILQQMYDELKKIYHDWDLPESVYFYTSRRAMLVAAATSIEDIRYIIELPDDRTLSESIRKRFEVDLDGEYEIDSIPDAVCSMLLECCTKEREAYNRYLEQVGIYSHERIAFVDFVALGTIQEALQRLSVTKMQGYFFLRRKPNNRYAVDIECESMYPMSGDFQEESYIYRFYYFLENIVSSYEPSFKRMKENGEYEFFEEPRTSAAIEQLKDFHETIMEYCKDFFRLYPNVEDMNAGITLYDKLLGFFDRDYMEIDANILNKVVNYDELLGKTVTELNR